MKSNSHILSHDSTKYNFSVNNESFNHISFESAKQPHLTSSDILLNTQNNIIPNFEHNELIIDTNQRKINSQESTKHDKNSEEQEFLFFDRFIYDKDLPDDLMDVNVEELYIQNTHLNKILEHSSDIVDAYLNFDEKLQFIQNSKLSIDDHTQNTHNFSELPDIFTSNNEYIEKFQNNSNFENTTNFEEIDISLSSALNSDTISNCSLNTDTIDIESKIYTTSHNNTYFNVEPCIASNPFQTKKFTTNNEFDESMDEKCSEYDCTSTQQKSMITRDRGQNFERSQINKRRFAQEDDSKNLEFNLHLSPDNDYVSKKIKINHIEDIFNKNSQKLTQNHPLGKSSKNRVAEYRKKNIPDLLHNCIDSHYELSKSFVNFDTEFEKFYHSKNLYTMITIEIKKLTDSIQEETNNHKNQKNSINFKRFTTKGFCSFCNDNKCLNTAFHSNFQYSDAIEKLFKSNTDAEARVRVLIFLREIEKITEVFQSRDIYLFFCYFHNLREKFQNLLHFARRKKIYSNIENKKEIIKNIYHDFRSKNLKLKVSLIPEFYSLLFSFLNMDSRFHTLGENYMFYAVYFYFRSLELFLDFIAQNDNYFEIQKNGIRKKIDEKKSIYLSLFIRINFVEPLVILITKSYKIIRRYRLHFFYLFEQKYQCSTEFTHDIKMIKFLEYSIWWICNCDKNIIADEFLDFYRNKDIDDLITANYNYFYLYILILKELKELRTEILSDALIDNIKHLKDFLNFCNDWYL